MYIVNQVRIQNLSPTTARQPHPPLLNTRSSRAPDCSIIPRQPPVGPQKRQCPQDKELYIYTRKCLFMIYKEIINIFLFCFTKNE